MHRSESDELIACAACGAVIDPARGRSYGVDAETALCWSCALGRGGEYDEARDRWVRTPDVGDLKAGTEG